MATVSQPPMRFASCSPRSPRTGTAWQAPNKSTPKKSPPTSHPTPPSNKWPVVPSQRSGQSIAHCMLRLDALPVRCICADDRLIYLAEAPLRGHAGHATPGGHTGRLTARDPRSGRVSRQLNGGGNALSCLLVTRDQEHVWTGMYDGMLRVGRRSGQRINEARAHAACVHAISVSSVRHNRHPCTLSVQPSGSYTDARSTDSNSPEPRTVLPYAGGG